jgi:hypothetical protein
MIRNLINDEWGLVWGKVLSNQTNQPMMAKPAIADATIHSARQNKVIRDKPDTKGFILS